MEIAIEPTLPKEKIKSESRRPCPGVLPRCLVSPSRPPFRPLVPAQAAELQGFPKGAS